MTTDCCDKPGKSILKNLDQALNELIQSRTAIFSTELIPLSNALNRVLAQDLVSAINVPPADNSAVDGYALNTARTNPETAINVEQRIPAGHVPLALNPGTAARIFTGANIPEGADCVVMQEDVRFAEDPSCIILSEKPVKGQNIRLKGQDISQGTCILKKGQVLSPQRLGLIASIGIPQVEVYKPLKVAIFSTGDELIEPGHPANEGQIYNSNRYLLTGFLRALNFEVLDLGLIADNLELTLETLKNAAEQADVVITTGGASVGEEDYVHKAIAQLGQIDFWKVAIKPGKPVMFGTIKHTPILGLPGNPGAVFVTFLILARPFLLHLQGHRKIHPQAFPVSINFDIKKAGIRREFLRVLRNPANQLEHHPNQSSGMLSSASWAEGFAVIREHSAPRQGDLVDFIPFDSLLSLTN